jgi:hypothetical protein
MRAKRLELAAAALAAGCPKAVYVDQAAARLGLSRLVEKNPAIGRLRVYPCDVCPAWHVTSRKVSGKTPAWDKNPNWKRPESASGGAIA